MRLHIINYITNNCTISAFKGAIIFIALSNICIINAQSIISEARTDELSRFIIHIPTDSAMYFSLARYYSGLSLVETSEFKEKQPAKILDYIPTLGLYAVPIDGKIRTAPRLSWSVNGLITRKRKENYNKAKIKSIAGKNLINMTNDYQKCLMLKRQVITIKDKLMHIRKIMTIDAKIYDYDSVRYQNQELNPDQFYESKKKKLNSEYRILVEIEKLESKIIQLKLTARIDEN